MSGLNWPQEEENMLWYNEFTAFKSYCLNSLGQKQSILYISGTVLLFIIIF